MRLNKRVALITGGGSGIGRASALLFAKEGAEVLVADLDESYALETAQCIKAEGAKATIAIGDVSNNQDAQRMVKAAVWAYGKLDILVNSAGVTARNALPEGASQESIWDRVMEINLKGTYLMSLYAVPEMEHSGRGSIVNLASIMGLVGYPVGLGGGFNPYPPSKGGVVQFTKTLAIDCARKNIRVNCICPGYIATTMTQSLTEDAEMLEQLKQHHPMGRLGQPKEIACASLFLASDESSFMTGAQLVVDGGYTAQ
jgi:NAD(P)-dependent dehydrogenase (short-subunit alcohol dehydrogenase family)